MSRMESEYKNLLDFMEKEIDWDRHLIHNAMKPDLFIKVYSFFMVEMRGLKDAMWEIYNEL